MEKLFRKYLTVLLKVNISVVVQRVAAKSLLLPNTTGPYVRLFENKFLSSVLKITTSPLPLRKSIKSININLFLEKAIKTSQRYSDSTFKNILSFSKHKHGKPILLNEIRTKYRT